MICDRHCHDYLRFGFYHNVCKWHDYPYAPVLFSHINLAAPFSSKWSSQGKILSSLDSNCWAICIWPYFKDLCSTPIPGSLFPITSSLGDVGISITQRMGRSTFCTLWPSSFERIQNPALTQSFAKHYIRHWGSNILGMKISSPRERKVRMGMN